ncbi:MAG: adenine-specific methyltransferase EcoRI family protein [Muribaculaceae bacterium]|nr:adenine-specific methyltransferase EcoRI family protein [Muribaculaceae bacterium]
MANESLSKAKEAKNDEFYTQYHDIEKEISAYLDYNPDVFRGKTVLLPCDDPEWSNFTKYFAQNFENFGLKRLISTSYAPESKRYKFGYVPTLFETEAPHFDADKSKTHGKIFVLDHDVTGDGRIDVEDLQWKYLEGDGDFRSKEICQLRDQADFIITNPPFSLFREFLAWILEADKQFVIIGNMNAVTYKEVFPLIKENKMWYGCSISSGDREFGVPEEYPLTAAGWRIDENGKKYIRVKGVRWFTNLDHGRRHQELPLMTMADNLKFSRHKEIRGRGSYEHYDNYDAIEVPFTDAIPSDYEGNMGVPISFLDKYCPEQFEIIGMAKRGAGDPALKSRVYTKADYPNYSDLNATPVIIINGQPKNTYPRILIRKKQ